jgi:hypothetical protein
MDLDAPGASSTLLGAPVQRRRGQRLTRAPAVSMNLQRRRRDTGQRAL